MVVCAFLMEKIITRLFTTGCDKKKKREKCLDVDFLWREKGLGNVGEKWVALVELVKLL